MHIHIYIYIYIHTSTSTYAYDIYIYIYIYGQELLRLAYLHRVRVPGATPRATFEAAKQRRNENNE